jgi:hypothetical protein
LKDRNEIAMNLVALRGSAALCRPSTARDTGTSVHAADGVPTRADPDRMESSDRVKMLAKTSD